MLESAFDSFARASMPWLLDEPTDDADRLLKTTAVEAFAAGSKIGLADKGALLSLLRECRTHLPLAAAFWNSSEEEDGNRQVADFHVPRVLELIERMDSVLKTGEAL